MHIQQKYKAPEYIESLYGADLVSNTLNNAPLRVSDFHANKNFLHGSSVCVFLNNQPFVMLGYSDCPTSLEVAERLVASPELPQAIHFFLGRNGFKLNEPLTLHHGVIENSDVEEHFYYNAALIANPQVHDDVHGCVPGEIQAIFHPTSLPVPVIQQIVFYITVNNELTKCFAPNAKHIESFQLKPLKDHYNAA